MFRSRFDYAVGGGWIAMIVAIFGVTLIATAAPAQADTFDFTSCHISNAANTGLACPPAGTSFGTVTLTQSGTSVNIDVVLTNGNRFVETGSGGGNLFDFNDTLAGSTITNITATLNGVVQTTGAGGTFPGGFSGLTNQAPFMADGTGFFTASVFCTTASDCNGGSTPNINDLHFTVTNATVAQLETANAAGNLFVADILCGPTVSTCAGLTGPVDVSAVPEPTTLLMVGTVLVGLGAAWRRRQRALAV